MWRNLPLPLGESTFCLWASFMGPVRCMWPMHVTKSKTEFITSTCIWQFAFPWQCFNYAEISVINSNWTCNILIKLASCATDYVICTLWVKKRPTIFSVHNFSKCCPIFKILSPLDSARNLQYSTCHVFTTT